MPQEHCETLGFQQGPRPVEKVAHCVGHPSGRRNFVGETIVTRWSSSNPGHRQALGLSTGKMRKDNVGNAVTWPSSERYFLVAAGKVVLSGQGMVGRRSKPTTGEERELSKTPFPVKSVSDFSGPREPSQTDAPSAAVIRRPDRPTQNTPGPLVNDEVNRLDRTLSHLKENPKELVDALCSDDRMRVELARKVVQEADERVLWELAMRFPGPIIEVPMYWPTSRESILDCGPLIATAVELGDAFAPHLVRLLNDRDPQRRRGACLCLNAVHCLDATTKLLELLYDPEGDVRRQAFGALLNHREGWLKDAVVEDLRKSLAKARGAERVAAAHVIGLMEDFESIPALIDLIGRPDTLTNVCIESLVRMTFQSFEPNRRTWRKWYRKHKTENRWRWLFEGLSGKEPGIRWLASKTLERDLGGDFGFDPYSDESVSSDLEQRIKEHYEST